MLWGVAGFVFLILVVDQGTPIVDIDQIPGLESSIASLGLYGVVHCISQGSMKKSYGLWDERFIVGIRSFKSVGRAGE